VTSIPSSAIAIAGSSSAASDSRPSQCPAEWSSAAAQLSTRQAVVSADPGPRSGIGPLGSASIGRGDFVALVGPVGLRQVDDPEAREQPPARLLRGTVFVGGREVGAEADAHRHGLQNPTLLPWLTIRDNVMLPLKIVPPFRQQLPRERKTEFRDRVDALLAQVGLAGFAANFPGSCRAA
jgi:hypothetical protein